MALNLTKKVLMALLCLSGAAAAGQPDPQPPPRPQVPSPSATAPDTGIRLNHIIYIIQENITFDHYFGTFPGADGIPKGTKLPYHPGGPPEKAPFHLHTTFIPRDLNHSWQAAHEAIDGGKMDGFLWAEWPLALAYYWKGTLPAINPDLVHPKPEEQANRFLNGENVPTLKERRWPGATNPPRRSALASRHRDHRPIGCSTRSPITTGTKFPTTGNTPGGSLYVTASSLRWPARASRTISIPWQRSQQGW